MTIFLLQIKERRITETFFKYARHLWPSLVSPSDHCQIARLEIFVLVQEMLYVAITDLDLLDRRVRDRGPVDTAYLPRGFEQGQQHGASISNTLDPGLLSFVAAAKRPRLFPG